MVGRQTYFQIAMTITKLTTNEKLTLALSTAALLVSLASTYFQFFRVTERVTVSTLEMNMPLGGRGNSYSLTLAFVNNGNRDVLFLAAKPEARGVDTKPIAEGFPFMLHPQEIRLITLQGTLSVASSPYYVETPLNLQYHFVGPYGRARKGVKRIGEISYASGELSGQKSFLTPIDLP
jgi:hypothetical protein